MLQSHQHGTPCPFESLLSLTMDALTYCHTLQAVYGAFARFRARHCLGAPQQQPSPAAISEGEATAVRMLQHVSDTAAAAAPTTEGQAAGTLGDPGLQQTGHSGMRSIPSQQSDLPSLASTQAEQGSADRQAMLIYHHSMQSCKPAACSIQLTLCMFHRIILSLLPSLLCRGPPLCNNCAITYCHLC